MPKEPTMITREDVEPLIKQEGEPVDEEQQISDNVTLTGSGETNVVQVNVDAGEPGSEDHPDPWQSSTVEDGVLTNHPQCPVCGAQGLTRGLVGGGLLYHSVEQETSTQPEETQPTSEPEK